VSIPSSMHILNFLPIISRYLLPFSISCNIANDFSTYVLISTCEFIHVFHAVWPLTHAISSAITHLYGVTTVLQLWSACLGLDDRGGYKITYVVFPSCILPSTIFMCCPQHSSVTHIILFFTSSPCTPSGHITPAFTISSMSGLATCVHITHDSS
jgi:hypothetical protein